MKLKSFLVGAFASVIALNGYAQTSNVTGLQKSISILQNQKSAKASLSFQVNDLNYTLSDVEVNRLTADKLILKSTTDFELNLVKNETGYHGTFVDHKTNKAYIIHNKADGSIYFKEHDIEKMTYSCNFDHHTKKEKSSQPKTRGYIGNYNTTGDVYQLESRPGAPFCILVDFDGNGNNGKYSGFGNNSYTVAGVSDDYAKIVWEQISDDFTQFDVNVTTNESVYNSYATSNKVLCAFAEFGLPGWKGIAYVGSFGDGRASLVDIAMDPPIEDAAGDARTGSHEIGHTLGLSHDGGGGDPYYSGHGEYVPIMGSGSRPVSHWSTCEFNTGSNHEDDIAIIAQSLNFIPDDITNSVNLDMSATGYVDATKNNGIIGSRADIDKFKFTTTKAGEVFIEAKPGIDKSNLDITLTLTDANGNTILSSSPVRKRSATIETTLQSGGTYYIEVDGGGELGVNDGWSDYSSQGYYELSGFVGGNIDVINDVELMSVEGLGNNCGETITPVVEIKNKGSQIITSFDAEVYVDGNLERKETITTNLSNGAIKKFDLTELSAKGNHDVEVKLSLTNGLDQLEYNNTKVTAYNLNTGNAVRFTTDYFDFTGEAPFTWSITSNGNEIANSANAETQEISTGKISQTTCVAAECYKVQFTSDYNTCESYPTYSGGTHTGGDVVVIDQILYEAKWWNTNHPSGPDWETVGECISNSNTIKLYNPNSTDVFVDITADDMNTSYEKDFCVSEITSTEELLGNSIQLYPNPSNGILNINTRIEINSIMIYNNQGQLVYQSNQIMDGKEINLSSLNEGLYIAVLKTKNQSIGKKILMK